MSVGSSRGQARACHIARVSSATTQFQAIPQFSRQNKDFGSPQASRKDFVSRKTIDAWQIDAERVILTNLTQMQATSLQVFELKSKIRNVSPLFRIRRKSFAMACQITLSVSTSYRGKSSEKIVQCDTRFRQHLHGNGSIWNKYKISTDKPCAYTEPGGSGIDWIRYLVLNGLIKVIPYRTIPFQFRTSPG